MISSISKKQFINYTIIGFGGLYCLLSALNLNSFFCFSSGCSIYKSYSLFGLSFYWYGLLAFISIGFLLKFKPKFLKCAILILLGLDLLFLLYQMFFLPCSSCLVVALLFFGLFINNYTKTEFKQSGIPKYVLVSFVMLAFFNVGSIAKEKIEPWPIYGNNQAKTKLFFSPTCESCKKMLVNVVKKSKGPNDIALYPIAKNKKDFRLTSLLKCELETGGNVNEAINKCLNIKEENIMHKFNFYDHIKLKMYVFFNKSHLLNMGKKHVPVLITNNYSIFQNTEKENSIFGTGKEFSLNKSATKKDKNGCANRICTF